MASYRPDPKLLALGPDFYDSVQPASFPQCTPRFLNRRWAKRIGMEMDQWPNLKAYGERVEARPKVQEALKAEGLA